MPFACTRRRGISFRQRASNPGGSLYVTFDLITALVVAGAFTAAALVYRRTAPPEGATTALSRGERLALALGAAATVIVIGGYLGSGFRGIEHAVDTQSAGAVKSGAGR